jgi:hypothetical protein
VIVRTDPTLEEIAAVLPGAALRNGELRAPCPAHSGDNPKALSMTYRGERLMATCHTKGCEFADIMRAIRERLGDEPTPVVKVNFNGHSGGKQRHTASFTWELKDASGQTVAYHVREDLPDGKRVRWRLPGGSWGLGGKGTADLPLYGAHEAAVAQPQAAVVVTEGEKAADALRRVLRHHGGRRAPLVAVGTVTGAHGTPGAEVLEVLRGRSVVLWPDNDSAGLEHMGRVAEALRGVASEVRWFEWEGAPEKGDAADHPATADGEVFVKRGLLGQLLEAPRWTPAPAIEGLITNMGNLIEAGVDPPEELLEHILLRGKAHNIYAPGGVGKTWVLVWLAKELLDRGRKVAIFDLENGLRTYAERLAEIGADLDRLNTHLAYGAFPSLTPEGYARFLEEWRPDIVMFDSWIGFLAADGRDENVSNDISAWADGYSKPALRRGVAVLTLDHVPHDHERERGSSRKRDEMDVVWKLVKAGDFDRYQTTALSMSRQKDREGWLPERLTFEIGGDPETGEFVMRRDDSLAHQINVTALTGDERKVLSVLEGVGRGMRAAEWQKASLEEGITKPTFYRIKARLMEAGRVERDGETFILGSRSTRSTEVHEPDEPLPDQGASDPRSTGPPPKGGVEPGGPRDLPASSPAPLAQTPPEVHGSTTRGLGARLRKIRDERRSR